MPRESVPLPTDWRSVLSEASTAQARRPSGKGWQTAVELAQEMGRARSTIGARLRAAVLAGTGERYVGTEETPCGLRPQVWYRAKR